MLILKNPNAKTKRDGYLCINHIHIMQIRKKLTRLKWFKLALAGSLVGFLASFLAISLKHITEHYEEIFFTTASKNNLFFLILPFVGLSVIYFLRVYLFKNKENKGIKEVCLYLH